MGELIQDVKKSIERAIVIQNRIIRLGAYVPPTKEKSLRLEIVLIKLIAEFNRHKLVIESVRHPKYRRN